MSPSRAILLLLLAATAAHADVTVQERIDLDVASIKAHGTTTQLATSDKERSTTEISCEGLLSMLCGKSGSLEVVRLDRGVILKGDAKKKSYTETPLPTPEQRQALEERVKAAAEKLKSCPPPAHAPARAGVDTSKCQMSPPVMSVTKADDVLNIVGHDTHHSTLAMTQSCTNHDTGDVCDMVYSLDLWLANDEVPALAERRAFQQAFLKKMGLEDVQGMVVPSAMGQFLGPYMEQMKKLGNQSADLKGYPLKSTFRVAFGGAHCAAAATGATSSPAGASSSAVGDIANKVLGSLFGKKKAADSPATKPGDSASGSAGTGAGTAGADARPANANLKTMAEFTLTTTALGTETIPADQFEMPADWKKIIPEEKGPPELPSCPKSGD